MHLRYLESSLPEDTLRSAFGLDHPYCFLGMWRRQKWVGKVPCVLIDSLRLHALSLSVDKIHIQLYIEIEFSCSQGKLNPIIILYFSLWIFILTFYNVVILKTDVICECLTLSL